MSRDSAGILMFRFKDKIEVLLVHPGGPFYKNKDDGFWGIPKGQVEDGESLLEAAIREFKEETGIDAKGDFIELGSIKKKSGNLNHIWAFEGNWDGFLMGQSYFKMEWPPKSGRFENFPEVDKIKFFDIEEARKKILKSQEVFLDRLLESFKS